MALTASAATAHGLNDALQSFQSILTDDQKRQLKEVQSVPDADAVLIFTAELDRQNAKRKGRSIATRLYTFLQCARDFSAVVDTFVQSHPEIAALVWGSVKLTMLIATNFLSYYEALTELFLNLGRICPRFSEYQALYPTSIRLQKSLCGFHASIVGFCKHVVEVIQRPWQKKLLGAFGGPFENEFKPDMVAIKRRNADVKDEIYLAKAQADLLDQQLQEMERQKASESRLNLKKFVSRTDDKLDNIGTWQVKRDKRRAREHRQHLLDSISKHDHLTPFKQSRRKRYPGTAEWLFKTSHFNQWFNEGASQMLWTSGKMGSGKTILSASVIDHILVEKSSPNAMVAFFFVRFDDQESLKPETILRSILRQVLQPMDLSGDLEAMLQNVSMDALVELRDLSKLICRRANQLKSLHVVVDGLDECGKLERREIMEELSWICDECPRTKTFLAGREDLTSEMRQISPTLVHVSMTCLFAQADIAIYVVGALQERLNNADLIIDDPSLVDEISDALVKGAEGMFLWVTFQLQELCSQYCDDDIRRAIGNLPKGLTETFNRALDRIITLGKTDIAKDIFLWAVAGRRPLTLEELREAVGIEIGQPSSRPERHVNGIHRLTSWCGNLVEVDEEEKTVHLVHQSVLQFLVHSHSEPRFRQFHIDPAIHF